MCLQSLGCLAELTEYYYVEPWDWEYFSEKHGGCYYYHDPQYHFGYMDGSQEIRKFLTSLDKMS